jgi:DNA-binding transcriptional MerR regulator
MGSAEIPEKLYYSIGEVTRITGIEAYVLRFWETEFPSLKPRKNKKGHRTYRKKDIEIILKIKELLYDNKFTIPGAREVLKGKRSTVVPSRPARRGRQTQAPVDAEFLTDIHHELTDILGLLERERSEDIFEE